MRIYAKNIPTKFHTDPIRNDRALGVLKSSPEEEKEEEEEKEQQQQRQRQDE